MITLEDMKYIIVDGNKYTATTKLPCNPALFLGDPGIGKSSVVRDTAMEIARAAKKKFVDLALGTYALELSTATEQIIDENDIEGVKEKMLIKCDESGSTGLNLINDIIEHPEQYYVYVDMRLTTVEPSDLGGIPRTKNDHFLNVPPLWAKLLTLAQGMLFLDELTIVQRDEIYSAAFMVIQDRRTAFAKFRDDVIIVAAGNTDSTSSIARPLPSPLLNRFGVYMIKSPTYTSWLQYMQEKYGHDGITHHIASFLHMHKGKQFCVAPSEAETLENFPTARTWEMFAKVYDENEPESILEAKCEAYLGPAVAKLFVTYVKVYKDLDFEYILANPSAVVGYTLNQKFAVLSLLGKYINDQRTTKKIQEVTVQVEAVVKAMVEANTGVDEYLLYLIGVAIDPAIGNKISKRKITQKAFESINPEYGSIIRKVLQVVARRR